MGSAAFRLHQEQRQPCPRPFATPSYRGMAAKGPAKGTESRKERGSSKAARVRQICARVLADGDYHPRSDLAAAVRKEGLSTGNLDNALGKTGAFIRDERGGKPVYILDPNSIEEAGEAVCSRTRICARSQSVCPLAAKKKRTGLRRVGSFKGSFPGEEITRMGLVVMERTNERNW